MTAQDELLRLDGRRQRHQAHEERLPTVAVRPSFTARLAAAVLWLDVLSDGVPVRWAPLRTVFAQRGQGLRRYVTAVSEWSYQSGLPTLYRRVLPQTHTPAAV